MLKTIACAAIACAAPATSYAATLTVGSGNSLNSNPFATAVQPSDWYQQEYAATAFGSAIQFDTISFRSNASNARTQPAPFTVSFYYTASNSLKTSKATNQGDFIGVFGTYNQLVSSSSVLSITGLPISYDPTRGNLLLQIDYLAASGNLGGSFFYRDSGTGVTSRAYNLDGFNLADDVGLVTSFNVTSAIAAVPEPATWGLMVLGFGAVGHMMRRRQFTASVA